MTGQLAAEFGYWENKEGKMEPAVILKAAVPRAGNQDKRYIIFLNQVWIYSEDHYERLHDRMHRTYESFMLHKCLDLFELFDLSAPGSRQLAETAWMIQDSIDKLLQMPPFEKREKKIIGEVDARLNDREFISPLISGN